MWTLKRGAKSGPRFGVRRIVFSFRGPQNGVQILGTILGSTLPVFFSQHDAQKGHPRVGCEQVRLLHKHIAGTGEDLAQGVGFWYAFLTSFWGPKTMVLSKREGLLPGPGLALSFWFPFFLELWLLSSCCLGLFSGAILVAIPCLDTGWILAWSFGCLFLLLFWLALSLLSWSLFCSLLLCSWVPGTRVGSLHGRFSSC